MMPSFLCHLCFLLWFSYSPLLITAISARSSSFISSAEVNVDGSTTVVVVDATSSIVDVGDDSSSSSSSLNDDNDDDNNDEAGEDFGVRQNLDLDPQLIIESLTSARDYLAHFNFSHSRNYRRLQEDCRNLHELCARWAVAGECQRSPLFMNLTCAPMCHSCEYLLPEIRCPLDPNAIDAWYPGDLNRMFERIVAHPDFQKYQPTILSSPYVQQQHHQHSINNINQTNNTTSNIQNTSSDQATMANYSQQDPWILQMDHVFTSEQANRWIGYGKELGYEPTYLAARKENYAFDSTYCLKDCDDDVITTDALMELVETWTGIPRVHYEHVNLLRYHVGQSSLLHTDYILEQKERQEGVRLLSILFYLNQVEEGGQTNFFHVHNVTVTPHIGRVIMWPNVLNDEPNRHDPRTDHQAFAVTKGIKYAAYLSIHQRNFKAPMSMHCTTHEN